MSSDVNKEKRVMVRLAQDSISLFIPMEWNYEGYIDSYGYLYSTLQKNQSKVSTDEYQDIDIGVIGALGK